MELFTITGNAFIELYKCDMPIVLSSNQLIKYGEVVSKKIKEPVDLSGAGLTNLKINFHRFLCFDDNGFIMPAKNTSIEDYITRCREGLSTKQVQAFESIEARKVLGINTMFNKKTYL